MKPSKEPQPWKASSSILVTESGRLRLLNRWQPLKQPAPMRVRDARMVKVSKSPQPLKAQSLREIRDSGRVKLVSLEFSKAKRSICCTLGGIVKLVNVQCWKAPELIRLSEPGRLTHLSERHVEKALLSI